jgi:hypothetical protein
MTGPIYNYVRLFQRTEETGRLLNDGQNPYKIDYSIIHLLDLSEYFV